MKNKLVELLYGFLKVILTSKDFVVFLKNLLVNNLLSFIVLMCGLFACGITIAFIGGCVFGDKAIETTGQIIKECINGVCYEKSKN